MNADLRKLTRAVGTLVAWLSRELGADAVRDLGDCTCGPCVRGEPCRRVQTHLPATSSLRSDAAEQGDPALLRHEHAYAVYREGCVNEGGTPLDIMEWAHLAELLPDRAAREEFHRDWQAYREGRSEQGETPA
ncbi:MAG: hypothetical protein ABMA01_22675, partial [Chthoniobacteraceae bacterium]